MWEENGEMMMKDKWFFRHTDTYSKPPYDTHELFAGNEVPSQHSTIDPQYDDNEISTIENKCIIKHISQIQNLEQYKTKPKNYYYR